ncbi:MAG: hypothetical protein U9N62_05560 [Thermotogota bacterium]|nr:hypothetical protein [Thermotogota bacterium]
MQESDFIIAINKNEDAPIMKIADLAIAGLAEKLIALTDKDLQSIFTCLGARFFKEISENPYSGL